jgi:23S rRNA (adenine1618-N6)-methyltransferase
MRPKPKTMDRSELHPRNRHRARYDFKQLIEACPALGPFVSLNPHGNESIDFANPSAVKTLNQAILKAFYGISYWDIPSGYLCPPIPGRADYIHHLADLLASDRNGDIPRGASIRALDIGVGANCVYPIIAHAEYGWRFVGSDIDAKAIKAAKQVIQANPHLKDSVELRLQRNPSNLFEGILQRGERFDLTLCNPPFHASLREAREGTQRKWRNLGKENHSRESPTLNFGGQGRELWCPGGEAEFVRRMIEESAEISDQCRWFTTLVSRASTLPSVHRALKKVEATDVRVIDMAQGQKKSRIVAWRFLEKKPE